MPPSTVNSPAQENRSRRRQTFPLAAAGLPTRRGAPPLRPKVSVSTLQPTRPDRANDGFTLAELLVASVLLAIILGAVYTAFGSSIRLWRLGETNLRNYQDARISLSVITAELQNAIPGAGHLFRGSNDDLEFFAVTPPLDVREGSEPRVLWIHYRLRPDPDGPGKLLLREERMVEGGLPPPPADQTRIEPSAIKLGREREFELAAGVKDFELKYYWLPPQTDLGFQSDQALASAPARFIVRDRLEEGDGIPQAVRATLTMYDETAPKGELVFSTFAVFRGETAEWKDDTLSTQPGEFL